MRYLTAALLGFVSLFILAVSVQAGDNSLEIASDSNFSSQTVNFSAGQTIYVRATANNDGTDKHQLNLRDNQYNLISTYNLNKEGSKFTTSLPAPSSEGYYSLEAQIVSAGSNNTSVKTIKVGQPQNANVKVSVKESSSGTSHNTESKPEDSKDKNQIEEVSPTPESSPEVEVDEQQPKQESFWTPVFNVALKIADFLWPF